MHDATVFVVDDDQEVRAALQLLMESVGLSVSTYTSAQDYLDQFDPERPGCIVLDVRMPGMSGLELQSQLADRLLCPPIIIITGHGDVPMAVRAVQAGAVDFIEKPYHEQSLLDAINGAVTRHLASRSDGAGIRSMEASIERLTSREREVLSLLLAGATNKVVARRLGISQRTAEAHRRNLLQKFPVNSVAEIATMLGPGFGIVATRVPRPGHA